MDTATDDVAFLQGVLTFSHRITFFTSTCGVTACVLSYFFADDKVQTLLYCLGSAVLILFSYGLGRARRKLGS
ncbi:MAG: hypothetical protein KDD69_03305 [Bdellovibrionales bacterium]|nr:hypothetical protein [Bdellovibrionales bacterium]